MCSPSLCLTDIVIYKVLKQYDVRSFGYDRLTDIVIYKVLKQPFPLDG